jgi:hypothetical protein
MNPVYTLPPYFRKIHFSIILLHIGLPSSLCPSAIPNKILYTFLSKIKYLTKKIHKTLTCKWLTADQNWPNILLTREPFRTGIDNLLITVGHNGYSYLCWKPQKTQLYESKQCWITWPTSTGKICKSSKTASRLQVPPLASYTADHDKQLHQSL